MERMCAAKEIKHVCLPPRNMFIDGEQCAGTLKSFMEQHGCEVDVENVEEEKAQGWSIPVVYYRVKLPDGSKYLRKGSKKVDALILIPGEESDYVVQLVRGSRVAPDKLLPNVMEVEKE
jgi:hypothetical protein